MKKDPHRYDDLLHLPRPKSTHPPMPAENRAAQFSPFAALTGYEACIMEEARLTDTKPDLDEHEKALLDEKLQELLSEAAAQPAGSVSVSVTHYVPDPLKEGGSIREREGRFKRIDSSRRLLIFYAANGISDGETIRIDQILDLQIRKGNDL